MTLVQPPPVPEVDVLRIVPVVCDPTKMYSVPVDA